MRASITGINGFIGNALNKRLLSLGWETFPTVRSDVDFLFLFGSPSSDHWYKYAKSYSLRETVENFINAADFCQKNDVKLVYPSSGTVHEGKTGYAKGKKIVEIIASMYPKTLGVRIFAGYGVGEKHKKEYSSTIYSFIKDMADNKPPVIWGDGEQTRDWIYITDIVENIIDNLDEEGIVEIGSGVNYSMNQIVEIINKKLHKNLSPVHVPKPEVYIESTICKTPVDCRVSLEEGIERIIKSL